MAILYTSPTAGKVKIKRCAGLHGPGRAPVDPRRIRRSPSGLTTRRVVSLSQAGFEPPARFRHNPGLHWSVWRGRVSFFNLYSHNFIRAAVAIPEVRVADPAFNAAQTVALMHAGGAAARRARGVSRSSGCRPIPARICSISRRCWTPATAALEQVLEATRQLPLVAVVGVPLQVDGLLYNCAAVISRGKILGVAPEDLSAQLSRVLRAAPVHARGLCRARETIDLCGQTDVPFGTRLLFQAEDQPLFTLLRGDLRGPVDADPAVLARRRWPAPRC